MIPCAFQHTLVATRSCQSQGDFGYRYIVLLTLGAHAPEGYGSCPACVSVCVCVSVRNLNLGTGASRGLNEGTSE